MHVISGDDDLFVNQHATADNTAIELNPEAFTYTEAKTTFDHGLNKKNDIWG
jgi:biofilm PGA synthesis N-glycosyltransferase PgaC